MNLPLHLILIQPREILDVLENVNKSFGVTIVIVSHEMEVIKSICNRVTVMADGEIYDTVVVKPKGIGKYR